MYHIETDKFTNNTVSVRILIPLERETITAWNLYVFMIKSKTEKYNTKQKLSSALNLAYAARSHFGLTGYGTQLCLDIRFEYIRPDFIDTETYTDQILDIMDQILYHPALDEENLQEAKYLLHARLLRQQEDPDTICMIEAFKAAGPDHDLSILVQGYLDQIDAVTLDDIRQLHETWNATPKQIHMVGVTDQRVMDFLEKIRQANASVKERNLLQPHPVTITIQTRPIRMTSLMQVYTTSTDMTSPDFAALTVMNSMFGQGQKSLLFDEVREKHSYCYSISSSLINFDGVLLVSAGIRRSSIDHVKELIAQQLNRLKTGDFPDSLMESAKLGLIDGLRSSQDRPSVMIERLYREHMLEHPMSQAQHIEKIRQVTREDIMRAAEKIELTAISIVQEEEECENEAET